MTEIAIFDNLSPREYQDVAMQMSCGSELAYGGLETILWERQLGNLTDEAIPNVLGGC